VVYYFTRRIKEGVAARGSGRKEGEAALSIVEGSVLTSIRVVQALCPGKDYEREEVSKSESLGQLWRPVSMREKNQKRRLGALSWR